jgi:hypothetical protein
MKRFILSLMVLVMFTPGLACAQFMQHQQPHMTQTAKDMPCCPKSKAASDMAGMLFKDCMKIDLQHANGAPILKKVDIAKHTFPVVQILALNEGFGFVGNRTARGPPFERLSGLSETHLPIFLATQRLRI